MAAFIIPLKHIIILSPDTHANIFLKKLRIILEENGFCRDRIEKKKLYPIIIICNSVNTEENIWICVHSSLINMENCKDEFSLRSDNNASQQWLMSSQLFCFCDELIFYRFSIEFIEPSFVESNKGSSCKSGEKLKKKKM